MPFETAKLNGFETPVIRFGEGDIQLLLHQIEGGDRNLITLHPCEQQDIGFESGKSSSELLKEQPVLALKFDKVESVDVVIEMLQEIKKNLEEKNV